MRPHDEVHRHELGPVRFLERAGEAYADRIALSDGGRDLTWGELRERARRFASSLCARGLAKGERVAFLAFNSEPVFLAHFAVPLAGGVLVTINTRLAASEIAYIVEQSGAGIVFYSRELGALLATIPAGVERIEIESAFESFISGGSGAPFPPGPDDERDPITINYTSGTTGKPKGVVYHHRGAYLNALAMALDHRLTTDSVFLWTLPMFHCNGWTFPWALTAVGARSICIPRVDPPRVWELLDGPVTHFCAAPTVFIMLLNHPAAHRLCRPIRVYIAGAPPSPTLIEQVSEYGFVLEHIYGLTETYGPFTINIPPADLASKPAAEQARLRARQGFPNPCAGDIDVVDDAMRPVPRDGQTMGEVVMRGNVVMTGYFGDDAATEAAFRGGWFHSGDIAVRHPDGSIELRDRKKDIIISGGENISTVEVEQAIASHPAVLECAVIPIPDDKWGEVPKAFVTTKAGAEVSADELIEHTKRILARFKAPKAVEFCELPKTSTGKIQKYLLREKEWQGHDKRIH